MLLFGNPSKETIDGLSDAINGKYDIETLTDMIDDLIKSDKSLSPLRYTKEDVENNYKTGFQDAIEAMSKIIDSRKFKNVYCMDLADDVWNKRMESLKAEIFDLKEGEQQ